MEYEVGWSNTVLFYRILCWFGEYGGVGLSNTVLVCRIRVGLSNTVLVLLPRTSANVVL